MLSVHSPPLLLQFSPLLLPRCTFLPPSLVSPLLRCYISSHSFFNVVAARFTASHPFPRLPSIVFSFLQFRYLFTPLLLLFLSLFLVIYLFPLLLFWFSLSSLALLLFLLLFFTSVRCLGFCFFPPACVSFKPFCTSDFLMNFYASLLDSLPVVPLYSFPSFVTPGNDIISCNS